MSDYLVRALIESEDHDVEEARRRSTVCPLDPDDPEAENDDLMYDEVEDQVLSDEDEELKRLGLDRKRRREEVEEEEVDEKCKDKDKKKDKKDKDKKKSRKTARKEAARSLKPVQIMVLEQTDEENTFYSRHRAKAIRSESHILTAVKSAVKEAMGALENDFDTIEISFTRPALVEKKEEMPEASKPKTPVGETEGAWPPSKKLDEAVGKEVLVNLVGGGRAVGKLSRKGDNMYEVTNPSGVPTKFGMNDVTRILLKKA